ncbi:hypothetical protein [Sphaerisporangium corydalis]|uniref:Uncharacterized protein n=1 Tax=Sphaerisporangium corydalis TaxID=1441875 RepID=A0ABV9EVS0_9ACTN|nr:hypothetical protein [Sphaerisporangium corydalis]
MSHHTRASGVTGAVPRPRRGAVTRRAGTALASAVLAGAAGLLVALPATSAHAATPATAPAATCAQATGDTAKGIICFLRYCDAFYCYYDCYLTAEARRKGSKPSSTIRVPKPKGTPPGQITRP